MAHVLSCVGEHGISGPVLGVAWDGNGFGTDETLWGGEFIHVDDGCWERVAFFRPFGLPGGETAIREPRRAALGVLYEFLGHKMFGVDWLNPMKACTKRELRILSTMLRPWIQCASDFGGLPLARRGRVVDRPAPHCHLSGPGGTRPRSRGAWRFERHRLQVPHRVSGRAAVAGGLGTDDSRVGPRRQPQGVAREGVGQVSTTPWPRSWSRSPNVSANGRSC